MSEPKYPRAFGVFLDGLWLDIEDHRYLAESVAEETYAPSEVVELIPLPEHQAIVAAAVAAERERCAGIAEYLPGYAVRPTETECESIIRTIAHRIREVTE